MRPIGLLILASTVVMGQYAGGAVRSSGATITSSVANAGHGGFRSGAAPTRRSGVVVAVPYSVGGYYYAAPYQSPDMSTYYPSGPQVVINQNFTPEASAQPIIREYAPDGNGGIRVYGPQAPGYPQYVGGVAPEPQAEAPPENPTYLIAFKDHTIYAAVAYWVEGQTLHYVTNQNTHNQVSLDLVDRELSDRLNRERDVDFRLPAAVK
jgi:hypothetical protein